jgi:hypothetical protein
MWKLVTSLPVKKTQANKFGPLTVNLGGAFAELVAPDLPQVNFSLEPISFLIDPASQSQATYQKIFKSTAEVLNPSVAAKVFCDANFSKISDAVTSWKNLADPYATNYDSIL